MSDDTDLFGENPASQGGLGGSRDVTLLAKAVKQRWIIPEQVHQMLPLLMLQMVRNEGSSDRAKIMAAKVIAELEKQNQSDEHKAIPDPPQEHVHHAADVAGTGFAALRERLGLSHAAGGTPAANGNGHPYTNGKPRPNGPGSNGSANGSGH